VRAWRARDPPARSFAASLLTMPAWCVHVPRGLLAG
jgi:hypothetical protein